MSDITYLSTEDRNRLIFLTEALRSVGTIEEQREIREEIGQIEDRRKPLHECDLNECTELRTTIFDKFDKLNKLGKYSLAQPFKFMLQRIEIRQAMLYREMGMKEAERMAQKAKDAKEQVEKQKKAKDDASQRKTSSGKFSSRWTTGVGSLD